MRVLVAPDKFKGSLTGAEVARAIEAGFQRGHPGAEIVRLPVADGGDGTLEAVIGAGGERIPVSATGPTGELVEAAIAVKDDTAFVEMAEASGLRRLPGGVPAPLSATTFGTGQLIRAALDLKVSRIVLGVGGSATTDGGAGMAQALGVRFRDAEDKDLPPGGAALLRLAYVDEEDLDPRVPRTEITVACDVDNPLIGPNGAAAVYGPQKGATAEDVELLDAALRHYALVLQVDLGLNLSRTPGAGAAGGLGAGAIAFLRARRQPGVDLVLDMIGFAQALSAVDLVITGEGRLDTQSLGGKAPVGVARAATAGGVPVVALAGSVQVSDDQLRTAGLAEAHSLADLEPDVERCKAEAGLLLEQLAEQLGKRWSAPRS